MREGNLTKLADVCASVRYGYTASASFEPCGPHFLRITDIVPDSVDWESVPYCEIDDADQERFGLAVGDIVVARTGATVGYAKLIREPIDAVFASYLVRFRVDASKAEPAFVGRLVESTVYKSFVQSRIGGAAQPNASAPVLGAFEFPLPSRHSQQRIADVLSAYDDLIENNRRRIALLEKMAEEIYREWFVRMRFPGHEQAKFEKGMPVGWREIELSEIAGVNLHSVKKGREPDSILYIDISAVSTNQLGKPIKLNFADAPGRARRLVGHGDVIWSSVRPGNRAYCLVLNPPDALIASTGFAVISPLGNVPFTYIHRVVTTESFVEQMVAVAKGAAYPATSFEDFGKAKVLLPTQGLIVRFHNICEPLLLNADRLRKQCLALAKIRDTLLPRLISGKLAVDDLDIRFPPGMAEASAHAI